MWIIRLVYQKKKKKKRTLFKEQLKKSSKLKSVEKAKTWMMIIYFNVDFNIKKDNESKDSNTQVQHIGS